MNPNCIETVPVGNQTRDLWNSRQALTRLTNSLVDALAELWYAYHFRFFIGSQEKRQNSCSTLKHIAFISTVLDSFDTMLKYTHVQKTTRSIAAVESSRPTFINILFYPALIILDCSLPYPYVLICNCSTWRISTDSLCPPSYHYHWISIIPSCLLASIEYNKVGRKSKNNTS